MVEIIAPIEVILGRDKAIDTRILRAYTGMQIGHLTAMGDDCRYRAGSRLFFPESLLPLRVRTKPLWTFLKKGER